MIKLCGSIIRVDSFATKLRGNDIMRHLQNLHHHAPPCTTLHHQTSDFMKSGGARTTKPPPGINPAVKCLNTYPLQHFHLGYFATNNYSYTPQML